MHKAIKPKGYSDRRLALSNHFNDIFDRAFTDFFKDDLFQHTGLSIKEGSFPKCNVTLTDTNLLIEAAIPGYSKDDISVTYKDDSLRISGTTQNNKQMEGTHLIREIKLSSFNRDFIIQDDVFDVDKIDASFDKGLLKITIPKLEKIIEKSEIKEIRIT